MSNKAENRLQGGSACLQRGSAFTGQTQLDHRCREEIAANGLRYNL